MKKLLIAGLAVLTIFAMTTMVVGCGGGDDDGYTPPALADDAVRFVYTQDGKIKKAADFVDVTVTLGETTFTEVLDDLDEQEVDAPTGQVFGGWKDASGTKWPQEGDDDVINSSLTFTAYFYSDAAGNVSDAYERLYLENGTHAVYKFTLPENATFGDYESISVSYKFSAATIATKQIRSKRVYGNFVLGSGAYPTDAEEGDEWGDFEIDANGAWAAKFDAHNAAYILDDDGDGWAQMSSKFDPDDADQWHTIVYKLAENRPNGSFVAANKPADTATGPFYFGLGIAGTGDPNGIDQFVKDIKMVPKSTSTVAAASGVNPKADFGGADQIFAGYIDPCVLSYRGDPSKPIAYPEKPVIEIEEDAPMKLNIKKGMKDDGWGGSTIEYADCDDDGEYETTSDIESCAYWADDADPDTDPCDGYAIAFQHNQRAQSAKFELTVVKVTFSATGETDQVVSTVNCSTYGGLGALNTSAGAGPFVYDPTYQYDAFVRYEFPADVEDTYDTVTITYKVERKDD